MLTIRNLLFIPSNLVKLCWIILTQKNQKLNLLYLQCWINIRKILWKLKVVKKINTLKNRIRYFFKIEIFLTNNKKLR